MSQSTRTRREARQQPADLTKGYQPEGPPLDLSRVSPTQSPTAVWTPPRPTNGVGDASASNAATDAEAAGDTH